MPKSNPTVELADRLVSELTASRTAGGDAYPVPLDRLTARLDPPADEAAITDALKNKAFKSKAIIAVPDWLDSPVFLAEDASLAASSPALLEALLKKGDGKHLLLKKLAAPLAKPLQAPFIAHLAEAATAGTLPAFAVAVPKKDTFALWLRDHADAATKSIADAKAARDAEKAAKVSAASEKKAADKEAKAAGKAAKQAEAKAAKDAAKAQKLADKQAAKDGAKAQKDADKAAKKADAQADKDKVKADKAAAKAATAAEAKAAKDKAKAERAEAGKAKPAADAAKLVDALKNWDRPAGATPLVTPEQLTAAAGLSPEEAKAALKHAAFAAVAVQGAHETLGPIVVLTADLAGLALTLLPHLIADCRTADAHAFPAAKLVAKLSKPLRNEVAAQLAQGEFPAGLPGGIGYVAAGDRLFFRVEDVKSAPSSPARPTPPAPVVDFAAAFDAAFTRLDRDHGSNNFVSLVDLRAALPAVPREAFDAGLRQLRMDRRFTLTSDERIAGLTPAQQAAAIREEGEFLLHVSRGRP